MDQETIYQTNKKTIIAFITALLFLIAIIDYVVLDHQHTKSKEIEIIHATQKLQLAAQFSLESMLKDDLVSIEQFLQTWASKNKKIISLNATTPNGFPLIDFKRDSSSTCTITVNDEVNYQGNLLLKLSFTEDISHINDALAENAFALISSSVIVVSFLGYFFWIFLRKTAITPLRQAISNHISSELKLKNRTKELELANMELESYSYSIAHDLRTPLRSITSFSQILKKDASKKLNEEEQDYLDRIVNAGTHMSQLIFDILELSRISRDKIVVKRVNLSEIANEICIYLKNVWPDNNFEIKIQENMIANGDEATLRSLLDNLLNNAYKYSSKISSPKIEFGVNNDDETPVYYIKDNGIGFNLTYADKIFTPFQRLHTDCEYEGTGIGLATAKRIVDKHNGKIWVETEVDKGTTFFFTLNSKA